MIFVVGPLNTRPKLTSHILRVEWEQSGESGLDYHTGRTLCGRRGVVRSAMAFHSVRSAMSRMREAEKNCGKCGEVAERWMR